MKLIFVWCEHMGDWYCIERAKHDGVSGFIRAGKCMSYWSSSWIGDADVEGPAEHMRSIARAIRARRDEAHKRCAVSFCDDGVYFYSPRNTINRGGPFKLAEADDLASQIEATLDDTKGGA